jgi:2'-5' RNA ligase
VPRLFVAVWPPEPVLDVVAGLSRTEAPGLRWTGRHQWHVTLRFLGTVGEVEPVVGALRTVPAAGGDGSGSVEAVLGPAVGRFGNRVLHLPVAGLDELAGRVVDATRGLGHPPEDREFRGHLTVARVAKGARVDLRRLAGEAVSERWTVGEVCLVESRLTSGGSRYEVLDRFPVASG